MNDTIRNSPYLDRPLRTLEQAMRDREGYLAREANKRTVK